MARGGFLSKKLMAFVFVSLFFTMAVAQWTSNSYGIYYSSGDVAIGSAAISSPLFKFNITGNMWLAGPNFRAGGSPAVLYLGDMFNSVSCEYGVGLKLGVASAPLAVVIGNGGYVGIGTATPLEKMHIMGNARLEGGQVRFYTGSADATGSTGIVGNSNGWTRLDPGTGTSSRFIIPIQNASDVTSAKNIFDIEDCSANPPTWKHLMELRADGSAFFMGKVGIGMAPATSQLVVNGKIAAKEVQVTATPSDFVFANNYPLKKLDEVESFIKQNKHLPDIPSGKEVEKNGYNVGEMQSKLLQKIEELTLYMIEQNKVIEKQQERIAKLESK
jgi:hypothetical protein